MLVSLGVRGALTCLGRSYKFLLAMCHHTAPHVRVGPGLEFVLVSAPHQPGAGKRTPSRIDRVAGRVYHRLLVGTVTQVGHSLDWLPTAYYVQKVSGRCVPVVEPGVRVPNAEQTDAVYRCMGPRPPGGADMHALGKWGPLLPH